VPRSRTPSVLSLLAFASVVWPLAAVPAHAAEQAVEVLVQGADKKPLEGAQIRLAAQNDPPFSATGATDASGKFAATLPDAKRTYQLQVELEGYVPFDQSVDLSKQHTSRHRAMTLEVTLPQMSAGDWFNRGVAALKRNDIDAAAAAFQRAVEIDPTNGRGWSVRALVAAEQKQWEVALDAAEHALALAPQDAQALRTRYDALVQLKRPDPASQALDQLVTQVHDGEVARLAFNAGAEAANHGDVAAARRRFAQALELAPELWQIHSALAELDIHDKDFEAALGELAKALAASPGNVRLLKRKVDVLEAIGDADRLAAAQRELAAAEATAKP